MGCRHESQFMLILVAEEEFFSETSALIKLGCFITKRDFWISQYEADLGFVRKRFSHRLEHGD